MHEDNYTEILNFGRVLAGYYSNNEQSQKEPSHFAHINIYFQPLLWSVLKGPGFYSEQSYNYSPWSPYRQTLHKISIKKGIITMKSYKLDKPERIAGAGFQPNLLNQIKCDSLEIKNGCSMYFKKTKEDLYEGELEPGCKCLIPRGEKITYLNSRVILGQNKWSSLDQGYDIHDKTLIWGSEYGYLHFNKIKDLGKYIDKEWIGGK